MPDGPKEKIYTVSTLNSLIKYTLETRDEMKDILLRGEIFGFTVPGSKHWYFSLRDEQSQIKCAMFRNDNIKVNFRPENGMKVVVKGSVDVYHPRGEYQLHVEDIRPEGLGSYHEALLKLMEKLKAKGLFAPEHKRQLPRYPRRVGVVTSATSAALKDMVRVAEKRFPGIDVLISNALVQGDDAPASLISALDLLAKLHRKHPLDVVVIARGGGSTEDLWCFNDEALAQAIYDFPIPTVSGIGHEIDYTIADFVVDRRAATPTAAFEEILPDQAEEGARITEMERLLDASAEDCIEGRQEGLDALLSSKPLRDPEGPLRTLQQRADDLEQRLALAGARAYENFDSKLQPVEASLDKLSPYATLARGYSLVEGPKGLVRSIGDAEMDDKIRITLSDGKLGAKVTKKEEAKWQRK